MATKQTPAKEQPPAKPPESVRLNEDDLRTLQGEARKARERVVDYGGDQVGSLIALLVVDLLLEMKEQNALAREALLLARK